MTRTLDKTHTVLSYIEGSLKNAIVMNENVQENGFIFSLINPPVPLGGNIVSLDIYVDELPISKKSIQIATSDTIVKDRKSTRLNSSHSQISYAVFCLKK